MAPASLTIYMPVTIFYYPFRKLCYLGFMVKHDDELIRLYRGNAAEHLVCADLLLNGFGASIAAHGLPYDVLADCNGRLLRVEVKSSHSPSVVVKKRGDISVYQFKFAHFRDGDYRPYEGRRFDVAALVSTDTGQIGYMPFRDVRTSIHVAAPGQVRSCRRAFEDLTLAAALAAD